MSSSAIKRSGFARVKFKNGSTIKVEPSKSIVNNGNRFSFEFTFSDIADIANVDIFAVEQKENVFFVKKIRSVKGSNLKTDL